MKLAPGVAKFASISLNSNSFASIVTRLLDCGIQNLKLDVAAQVEIGFK